MMNEIEHMQELEGRTVSQLLICCVATSSSLDLAGVAPYYSSCSVVDMVRFFD